MKKIIVFFLVISSLFLAFFGYKTYSKYYGSNVSKSGYIIIPSDANFNQIIDSLSPFLKDKEDFIKVAKKKNLDKYFTKGRYRIKDDDNNTDIVNRIKSGSQSPIQFRIGDFGNIYQMIGKVCKKTEIDSLEMLKGLDLIAQKKGLKSAEDLKMYFLANTYDFFWTVTADDFFKVFQKEYNNYWTDSRKALAEKSGLSRTQIIALASIVGKESAKAEERSVIAGLYINRFKKGMKLQSDPTVIYAINQKNNFSKIIKRLYNKDLSTDSPYNTYQNIGIPPGPICIVSADAVSAVLDAEKNDHIFMCADPDRPGYHRFTNSGAVHVKNAKDYANWLNKRQIR